MSEIEQRLKEASEKCGTCFTEWSKDKKNSSARENLLEAIHELRKVTSRLEIEIAVSEGSGSGQKPMPIPTHKDSSRKAQGSNGNKKGDDNNNAQNDGPQIEQKGQRRRRPPQKKAADGQG